jgi:threonine/homoserine/homoserine lactone efflux protein
VNTGLLIWTATAAFGLAAIVRESAVAFTALKIVGALYLVWLGLQTLRTAGHRAAPVARGVNPRRGMVGRLGFRQGLLSDLANPKIGVFFTGLLPQFVSLREPTLVPFLLLGGTFVLITIVWLCGYAVLAARASALLSRSRVKAALDRITGVVLIGLGVRLALERR